MYESATRYLLTLCLCEEMESSVPFLPPPALASAAEAERALTLALHSSSFGGVGGLKVSNESKGRMNEAAVSVFVCMCVCVCVCVYLCLHMYVMPVIHVHMFVCIFQTSIRLCVSGRDLHSTRKSARCTLSYNDG
jgi:hypothetical protein